LKGNFYSQELFSRNEHFNRKLRGKRGTVLRFERPVTRIIQWKGVMNQELKKERKERSFTEGWTIFCGHGSLCS